MQLFMKHPFSDYKVLHIFCMRKQFINRITTILKVETDIIACITVNPIGQAVIQRLKNQLVRCPWLVNLCIGQPKLVQWYSWRTSTKIFRTLQKLKNPILTIFISTNQISLQQQSSCNGVHFHCHGWQHMNGTSQRSISKNFSTATVTSDVSKHKSVDGKHEAEKTNISSFMDRKIPTGKVEWYGKNSFLKFLTNSSKHTLFS